MDTSPVIDSTLDSDSLFRRPGKQVETHLGHQPLASQDHKSLSLSLSLTHTHTIFKLQRELLFPNFIPRTRLRI